MKNQLYSIALLLFSAISVFYGCADNIEGITPEAPEVIIPEKEGLKINNPTLLFDASGYAVGIDLRCIGGKWQAYPGETCDWLEKISPEEGEAGNNIIAVTLATNEGLSERSTFIVIKHLETGDTSHVNIRQYTHESKYNRESDSLALVSIYQALSDAKEPNWMNPWNIKKPITTYNGVEFEEINGEQRVVGLQIAEFQMSGELPNSLGNLRELKKLKIPWGSLSGRIPNAITNLRKLEEIDIAFKDNVTWFVPENISDMKSLRILHIGQLTIDLTSFDRLYQLSSLESMKIGTFNGNLPEGISALTNLKVLDFSYSRLKSLPKDFGQLSNLEKLNLNGCERLLELPDNLGVLSQLNELMLTNVSRITHLPENFGQLQELTTLGINGCIALEGLPESFTQLKKLSKLDLSNCKSLKKLPATIGNMSQLTAIDFSNCEALTALPESFGNLIQLTQLQLRSCSSLTALPESIGNLKAVTQIEMTGCNALTFLPSGLGELSNLKKLNITTEKSVALPSSFANLTNLEEFNCNRYGGTDGIEGDLSLFANMTNLKKLEANYNNFSGDLATLANLSNLTVIKLGANHLGGTLNLSSFLTDKITELDLSENELTGNLNGMTQGTSLQRLYLQNNKLTSTLPEDMDQCSKLTTLDLSANQLTGNLPVALARMNFTWGGLLLKNNNLSGIIDDVIVNSQGWKQKWYPDKNILPQNDGYGFSGF